MGTIADLTELTTPDVADLMLIRDVSDATNNDKRITWTTIRAFLKTYLDTLYVALTGAQTVAGAKTFSTRITASAGIMSSNPTIADDAVATFAASSGVLILAANNNSTISATISFRAAASGVGVYCVGMQLGSNVNVTTGVLAGTTGTDGKVTVSAHSDGNVYIENRTGTPLIFCVLWIAPV